MTNNNNFTHWAEASGNPHMGRFVKYSRWQRFNRWLKVIDYELEDYGNIIKVAGWPIAVLFATLYFVK